MQSIGAPALGAWSAVWRRSGLWDSPEFCAQQLQAAGFEEVQSHLLRFQSGAISIPEFLKLLEMFLPMAVGAWDADTKAEKMHLVLPAYRKALEARYPDGVVTMGMEAVITTGIKA